MSGKSLELPQATISRIIRSAVPENMMVGKEAKAAFTRAASIFVLYLTSTANEFCKTAGRQTVSALDVMAAVEELEFEEFLDPLEKFLAEYRTGVQKRKASKKAPDSPAPKKAKTIEEKSPEKQKPKEISTVVSPKVDKSSENSLPAVEMDVSETKESENASEMTDVTV
eukprot:204985_1